MSLRVGVIGVGYWGQNHVRVLKQLDNIEALSICDLNTETARLVAKKYQVKWYTDFEEMIKREKLDAVTICTPTSTHSNIAVKVIELGVHVFIEKPMTSTIEEAIMVVDKANEAGVKIMVGFIERFNPAVQISKKLIRQGKIGKLILSSAKRVSAYPIRIVDVDVIKDYGIHEIDVARYLYEKEPSIIFAAAGKLIHRLEDHANILMLYNSGESAFIETNWLTPKKIRKLTLTGTNGIIDLDYITQEIIIQDSNDRYIFEHEWEEPLSNELKQFINSIINNFDPTPSGKDALMTHILAEVALQSAFLRKAINVDEYIEYKNWIF
ncbi:MAG: Gfo/Idh/MocA family oxidoreductase [Candidatus Methanomethylicia archaeon]